MELARASKTEKHGGELPLGRPLHFEEAFEATCQQSLLKKERRAKNCLIEVDSVWQNHPKLKRESVIDGWADLDGSGHPEPRLQLANHHNKSTSQTIQLKQRSVTQTSSLIPNLKQELSRLESPQRRKKESLPGSHLFNLQVMSELNRKRKHSLKVSEIIRCRENRFMATSHFKKLDIPQNRPFTNAENRLNQNKCLLKKIVEVMPDIRLTSQQPYRVMTQQQPYEPDCFNENELRRFLKPNNPEAKHLKTSKDFHLSKLDHARVSKNSFYHERRKDRLTLKNLLDL